MQSMNDCATSSTASNRLSLFVASDSLFMVFSSRLSARHGFNLLWALQGIGYLLCNRAGERRDLFRWQLVDPEQFPIKITESVGADYFRRKAFDHSAHHARCAVDGASLQREQPLSIAYEAPLAGILGKRSAEADPNGFLRGQRVAEYVCRLAGHLPPQTGPVAAHDGNLLALLPLRVLFAEIAGALCLPD